MFLYKKGRTHTTISKLVILHIFFSVSVHLILSLSCLLSSFTQCHIYPCSSLRLYFSLITLMGDSLPTCVLRLNSQVLQALSPMLDRLTLFCAVWIFTTFSTSTVCLKCATISNHLPVIHIFSLKTDAHQLMLVMFKDGHELTDESKFKSNFGQIGGQGTMFGRAYAH